MQPQQKTVVLCDLPNLQHWPRVMYQRDFESNQRVIATLEIISDHFKELKLSPDAKFLFGDMRMYDHDNFVHACEHRGWTYIPCPTKVEEVDGEYRKVSVSDDKLKETFRECLRDHPDYKRYVFITDDTDFIPDALLCLDHFCDVTFFISGAVSSRKIRKNLPEKVGVVVTGHLQREKFRQSLKEKTKLIRAVGPSSIPSAAIPKPIQTVKKRLTQVEKFYQRYPKTSS